MHSSTSFILPSLFILLVFIPSASAFGAGEVPDFGFLHDKAYRHLDIENILENIVRWTGSAAGGGLMGFISNTVSGQKKFTKADVKRVYFGNWLRDYSQAMDIAGLSKASSETILLLLSVLGFMTFGYSTEEFELAADKLGVYLPVEHIVSIYNPKGYGAQDDPKKYHPKLRGPVDPRELEVDSRTGMKNYIANDGQGWDTSAAHVRRSLEKAIQLARQSGGNRGPELYEAYRLMGGALHTLEDLLAHSNWIELSLNKMGQRDIFVHVGDSVTVNAPGGQRVPPLVTGTFGSADFIFSVMGEAGDKLSESSVSELSKKASAAKQQQDTLSTVKNVLAQVPSGGESTESEMQKADELQKKAYSFDPDNYATEEVQKTLWDILVWRDTIMRKIEAIIENIPGMESVLEQLSEALSVYVFTTIEPYIGPVLSTASDALGAGSRMVIDQDDQYEVFNNGNASDPSHSMISKDHFDNILNDPAGKIAKVVVEVAVNKIVAAWSDNNVDVGRTVDEILAAFHHPYFADERSEIQMAMAQTIKRWFDNLGNDREDTLARLTKESVRDGKNKRIGADENTPMHSHTIGASSHTSGHGPSYGAPYSGGSGHHTQSQGGHQQQKPQATYGVSQGESRRQEDSYKDQSRPYGRQEQTSGYGRPEQSQGYRQQESAGYGQKGSRYGREEETTHGGGRSGYGREEETGRSQGRTGYGREEETTHGGGMSGYGREEETGRGQGRTGYGREEERETSSYGQKGGYSSQEHGRSAGYESQSRNTYGQEESSGYGGRETGHQSGRREEEHGQSGYGGSSGGRRAQEAEYGQSGGGYGGRGSKREEDDTYGVERLDIGGGESRGYGDRSGYGGGNFGSYGDDDDDDRGKKHHKHQKHDDDY